MEIVRARIPIGETSRLASDTMNSGEPRSERVFRSRFALAIGFGGLLSIMALAGIDALRVLQQFRRSDEEIRSRYLSENHVLNDIRSDVYVSGTYVRDYLLEAGAAESRGLPRQPGTGSQAHAGGAGFLRAPDGSGGSRSTTPRFGPNWRTIGRFLAPIFQWDAAERRRSGYSFLRDEVFPRRQNMLAIAGRIADLNEQQLDAGNHQVVSLLLGFQTRLLLTLLAALALGLGLALFTMRKDSQAWRTRPACNMRKWRKRAPSSRNFRRGWFRRRRKSAGRFRANCMTKWAKRLSAVLVELRNLSTGLAVRSEEQSRRHVETIKSLVEGTVRVVRNMALSAAAVHAGRSGS